jgi:hypothetical protein
MSDPTGTAGLRRSFLAEGSRRLAKLRSLTHQMLVEHDLMAARNDPLAALLSHPGHRLSAFAEWFSRSASEQLGGQWWERFLERAYQSGLVTGSELVRSGAPSSRSMLVPAVYRELASREFAGIAAALVQQVTRQAATAAVGRRKPLPMYQRVLTVLKKVGAVRMRAAINSITVQLHNVARLAQFRAAGVTQVGVVPEKMEQAKRSRFLKHDHLVRDQDEEGDFVNVLTAGDDLVCIVCEDISDEGPYPLDEAETLIPAHPNCRCAFVPAFDMRFAINREKAAAQ